MKYYDFVPKRKDSEIRMHDVQPESIGKFVRDLDIEETKKLFQDRVHQVVEYNTSGFLVWIPPLECFEYWKWAQPHIVRDHSLNLDDYPQNFALSISEWVSHSGVRLIIFSRYH